jgi:GNAT superfamily N-acetyltransferase
MNTFDRFYDDALLRREPLTDPSALQAIWAHRDGRCLGMTGVSDHVIDVIPPEFVRSPRPFDHEIDIYVRSERRRQPNSGYRAQAFQPQVPESESSPSA